MARSRTYSDADLAAAVAASRSWRGVLRALGLKATSASALRSVRARADRLGLGYDHFTGQRRWSDADLSQAIRLCHSWAEVAERLGLAGGSSHSALRGHAARLGLATDHLGRGRPAPTEDWIGRTLEPSQDELRRAGSMLAAAWFSTCGCNVSWPLEPAVYDLLVEHSGSIERVQVKTTTRSSGATWVASLTRSSGSESNYDIDDIDYFFVVDGDFSFYLIPSLVVGGLGAIQLAAYAQFRVGGLHDRVSRNANAT